MSLFRFPLFLEYGSSGRAYDQLWFLSCSCYSELIQVCWNAAVQLWLRNVECGDLLSAARHGSVLKLACRRGCSGHRYDLPRVVVDDLVFHVGLPLVVGDEKTRLDGGRVDATVAKVNQDGSETDPV